MNCRSEVSLEKSECSSQQWLHEKRDDAFRVERNSEQRAATFTLNQHGSFRTQPFGSEKVTMSREGNRDTLKVVCMLKPRDALSVTSLIFKRELENARRELRNLKTGQHDNK